jgi:hypothetical protein
MQVDAYVRTLLTVIAAALVYLCLVLTPWPAASAQGTPAQGARTPGESTGPAEVVIVGWRYSPDLALPVQIPGPITIGGEVQVTGQVETRQAARSFDRVVLAGWEAEGTAQRPGTFTSWDDPRGRALPVTVRPAKP